MTEQDCNFVPPITQDCVTPDIIDVEDVDAGLDFPLLPLPCIPAFSGSVAVSITPIPRTSEPTIKIRRDDSSECGYKITGNINVCVPSGDAFVDSDGVLRWRNPGGNQTTRNGTIVAIDGSDDAYDCNFMEVFQFWNCTIATSATTPPPDQTRIIPRCFGDNGEPPPCVDTSSAWVDRDDIELPVLKWKNDDGEKTIVRTVEQDLSPAGGTTSTIISQGTLTNDIAGITYQPSLNYKISFWKCNPYEAPTGNETHEAAEAENPPDKIVTIEAEFGTSGDPYNMGRNTLASLTGNGPVWGGTGDGPPNPDEKVAKTDVWERAKPPVGYTAAGGAGSRTDGVGYSGERVVKVEAYGATGCTNKIFRRKATFDSFGMLTRLGAEEVQDYV